jgi:hypothetical protein
LEIPRKSVSRIGLSVRPAGGCRSYVKEEILRPVVIPTYSEVPVSIIRNNLKTAGISRDEYFRLLDQTR